MPTYRKLHTKALESQDIADMPDDFCRLTWLLLPLAVSREGTTVYQAHYLCSKLYPMRQDVTDTMVAAAFSWYEQHGMIRTYEVSGRRYLWIPTFEHYQGICDKEGASQFPPVPDSLRRQVMTNSVPTPEQVMSKSALDVDVDVDTDAKVDTKPAAPELGSASPADGHNAQTQDQALVSLWLAFLSGTGQPANAVLPIGPSRTALVHLCKTGRAPADVEGCAVFLKAGWWADKTLTVGKVDESIGQWITAGRPDKPPPSPSPGKKNARRGDYWDTPEGKAALKAGREADRLVGWGTATEG